MRRNPDRMTRHRRSGQALVEFALIFPIFVILLMLFFDFGRAIFAYNNVSNAARLGGRTAIVNQVVADIRARAAAQAIGLAIPTSDPLLNCPANGGPPGSAVPAGICVKILERDMVTTCSPVRIGCVAVVSVKYTFRPNTPVIGNIISSIPVSYTTKQTIEATCDGGGCTTP